MSDIFKAKRAIPDLSKGDEIEEQNTKPISCGVCKFRAQTTADIQTHIKEAHVPMKDKVIFCVHIINHNALYDRYCL